MLRWDPLPLPLHLLPRALLSFCVFLNPSITGTPSASASRLVVSRVFTLLSHALEGISGFLKPGLGAQRAVTGAQMASPEP